MARVFSIHGTTIISSCPRRKSSIASSVAANSDNCDCGGKESSVSLNTPSPGRDSMVPPGESEKIDFEPDSDFCELEISVLIGAALIKDFRVVTVVRVVLALVSFFFTSLSMTAWPTAGSERSSVKLCTQLSSGELSMSTATDVCSDRSATTASESWHQSASSHPARHLRWRIARQPTSEGRLQPLPAALLPSCSITRSSGSMFSGFCLMICDPRLKTLRAAGIDLSSEASPCLHPAHLFATCWTKHCEASENPLPT